MTSEDVTPMPFSNIHAPNENIKISDLAQGSKLIATLISEFAEMEE